LLANFGQLDVGYAGVATGRGGFNLPFKASYDKSTSTLFAVQFQGLDATSPFNILDFAVFPLSRQKLSNLGQHDVGHKGVATGRRVFSLCSLLLNGRLRFS